MDLRKYCTDSNYCYLYTHDFLVWLRNVEHDWLARNQRSIAISRLTGLAATNDPFPIALSPNPNELIVFERPYRYKDSEDARDKLMEVIYASSSN